MSVIQIILIAVFVLAAVKAILRFRSGDIGSGGLFFWIIFWSTAAIIAAKPDATFYFAKKLGVGRGADLVVYSALVLLFFLIFRLMTIAEKQKKEITELARALALRDANRETQKYKINDN